jgi:hypothetical protein
VGNWPDVQLGTPNWLAASRILLRSLKSEWTQ